MEQRETLEDRQPLRPIWAAAVAGAIVGEDLDLFDGSRGESRRWGVLWGGAMREVVAVPMARHGKTRRAASEKLLIGLVPAEVDRKTLVDVLTSACEVAANCPDGALGHLRDALLDAPTYPANSAGARL